MKKAIKDDLNPELKDIYNFIKRDRGDPITTVKVLKLYFIHMNTNNSLKIFR